MIDGACQSRSFVRWEFYTIRALSLKFFTKNPSHHSIFSRETKMIKMSLMGLLLPLTVMDFSINWIN